MRSGFVWGAIAAVVGAAAEVCFGLKILAVEPEGALGEFITAAALAIAALALLRRGLKREARVQRDPGQTQPAPLTWLLPPQSDSRR